MLQSLAVKIKKQFRIVLGFKTQIRNLSLYVMAALTSSFIGVLINPFLAANLSPHDYAIIGYFNSFKLLILPLVGMSFISYYSRNYFLVDEEKRRTIMSTLVLAVLGIGFLLLLISLGIFYIYVDLAEVQFPFYPYAILGFFPVFFTFFFSFYLNDKKLKAEASKYFKATLANALLIAALSIGMVVVFKWGAVGRMGAILIGTFTFGIVGIKSLRIRLVFDRRIFWDALKFCWPISLSAMMYFFLNGVDKVMLERLGESTTFGYYNVGFQISAYLGLFGTALIQTFDPDIFKAIANNNIKRLFQIVLLIVIPCVVMNLLFIWLADPVIRILTYGRYMESVPYARILTIRNIATPLAFVISGIIVGYGFPKIDFIIRILSAAGSIALFKILISRFGFFGASWGQTLAMVIMVVLCLSFLIYKKQMGTLKPVKSNVS